MTGRQARGGEAPKAPKGADDQQTRARRDQGETRRRGRRRRGKTRDQQNGRAYDGGSAEQYRGTSPGGVGGSTGQQGSKHRGGRGGSRQTLSRVLAGLRPAPPRFIGGGNHPTDGSVSGSTDQGWRVRTPSGSPGERDQGDGKVSRWRDRGSPPAGRTHQPGTGGTPMERQGKADGRWSGKAGRRTPWQGTRQTR